MFAIWAILSLNVHADSISFGITDDNYDRAQDWGFVDTSVSTTGLDARHETIVGALHNFNKSFAAGMDTSADRVNKAYFKISF